MSSDVDAPIDAGPDPGMRADSRALVALIGAVTGKPSRAWSVTLVGFGWTGQCERSALPRMSEMPPYLEE